MSARAARVARVPGRKGRTRGLRHNSEGAAAPRCTALLSGHSTRTSVLQPAEYNWLCWFVARRNSRHDIKSVEENFYLPRPRVAACAPVAYAAIPRGHLESRAAGAALSHSLPDSPTRPPGGASSLRSSLLPLTLQRQSWLASWTRGTAAAGGLGAAATTAEAVQGAPGAAAQGTAEAAAVAAPGAETAARLEAAATAEAVAGPEVAATAEAAAAAASQVAETAAAAAVLQAASRPAGKQLEAEPTQWSVAAAGRQHPRRDFLLQLVAAPQRGFAGGR